MQKIQNPARHPMKIVRALMVLTGRNYVFNDRLKDGRRSIKVWGWSEDEWRLCIDMLRAHGFTVAVRMSHRTLKPYRVWVDLKR